MSIAEKAVLIVLCVAYVVCPLDGDFIPFLGWIDDAVVVWLTYRSVTAPPKDSSSTITVDHVG